MKIIDANTGQRVHVGVPFENVDGLQVLMKVDAGLFRARALRKMVRPRTDHYISAPTGDVSWVPLVVRYTHPAFFMERVAFYPS